MMSSYRGSGSKARTLVYIVDLCYDDVIMMSSLDVIMMSSLDVIMMSLLDVIIWRFWW